MKVCVFGAGAVGGHIAALLALAGNDTSVVVRGDNLSAIRASGITLRTDDGTLNAPVRASDDAASLGVQDIVIVTLKSTMLAAAAHDIAALAGPDTPIVMLQNGIPWWYPYRGGTTADDARLPALDPGDTLWNTVRPERVLGGTTGSACTLVGPGVIEVKGGHRMMSVGEPDGRIGEQRSERLARAAALLRHAGFPVDADTDIRKAIWRKLTLNLASGPMTVLVPIPMKDMYADDVLVDARRRIVAEVVAVAASLGYELGVDVEAQIASGKVSPHIPSIGQDVLAGRKLEVEAILRAPLAIARAQGVPTPTLDLLVSLAVHAARRAGLYP